MAPSPLAGVKALLFDVFGTVVDWQGSVHEQLVEKVEKDKINLGDIDMLKFTIEWRTGYLTRTKEIAAGAPGPTNVDVLHLELLNDLLTRPEYSILKSSWNKVTREEICQYWHKLDGWVDSAKGIEDVRTVGGKGILVGTLSNGSARLLIDLARHANLNWDFVFSADLLKTYKPNPDMYLGACTLLSLEPGEVAMVASHIYDCESAAKYGLKTIYIPRPTEDLGMKGFDSNSVVPKSQGGPVDVVIKGLGELSGLFA